MAELTLALGVEAEIMEADGHIRVDGGVELVHQIVDGLVHGFDAVLDPHLTPQAFGLMHAGELFDLLDELHGLAAGDESGGLYAVHQQPQLRQLKVPLADIPAAGVAPADAHHVHPEKRKSIHVVIDGLSLRGDPLGGQVFDQLRRGGGVLLVRFFLQVLPQIQQLRFLVGRFCHRDPSREK